MMNEDACIKAVATHRAKLAKEAQVKQALGLPITEADEMALFAAKCMGACLEAVRDSRPG